MRKLENQTVIFSDELDYGKTKIFTTVITRRMVFLLGNLRASNMILYIIST